MNLREKMVEYDYNEDLQVTLLLNGLLPQLKSLVLQHLPFENMEAFITKTKHIEAAIESNQNVLQNPQNIYTVPIVSNSNFPVNMGTEKENEDIVKTAVEKVVNIVRKRLGHMKQEQKEDDEDDQFRGRSRNRQKVWFQDDTQSFEKDRYTRCFTCGSFYHLQRDCNAFQPRFRSYSPRGSFRSNSPGRGNQECGHGRSYNKNQFSQFPMRYKQYGNKDNRYGENERSYSDLGNEYARSEERREGRFGYSGYRNRNDFGRRSSSPYSKN